MESSHAKIAEKIGLDVGQVEMPVNQPPSVITEKETGVNSSAERDADFKLARDTIRDAISTGTAALDELVLLAKETESARAFEVVSTHIKTLTEISTALMKLHEDKTKQDPKNSTPQNVTNNNIVFQGTTAQLLDQIIKRTSND